MCIIVDRRFIAVPAIVGAAVFMYALKALRGDFDAVPAPLQADMRLRVRAALNAVDE